MEWVLMPLRRFADFAGRSRRKEFWSWFLFYVVGYIAFVYLDQALGLGGSAVADTYSGDGGVGFNFSFNGGWLTILFCLALLIPTIAVSVRRMHDIGKSGWHVLIGIIPIFGWAYVLYCYIQPGIAGPNQYGPDPKAAG